MNADGTGGAGRVESLERRQRMEVEVEEEGVSCDQSSHGPMRIEERRQ